jgi:acyl carrier protein
MSRNEILERVKGIVARETNLGVGNIDLDTKLESIHIDSLDLIRVAAAIENDFKVTIMTTDLMQMITFGDMITGLESKLAGNSAHVASSHS